VWRDGARRRTFDSQGRIHFVQILHDLILRPTKIGEFIASEMIWRMHFSSSPHSIPKKEGPSPDRHWRQLQRPGDACVALGPYRDIVSK
jgi:hypothetical protein